MSLEARSMAFLGKWQILDQNFTKDILWRNMKSHLFITCKVGKPHCYIIIIILCCTSLQSLFFEKNCGSLTPSLESNMLLIFKIRTGGKFSNQCYCLRNKLELSRFLQLASFWRCNTLVLLIESLRSTTATLKNAGNFTVIFSEKIIMLVPRDRFTPSLCCLQRHWEHFDVPKTTLTL